MSNSIDPDSIHLGGNDAQYYAAYIPTPIPEPGTPCALPPEIPWNVHTRELLPLSQSCLFAFPDVTPLPPIYNPPVFNFASCETLSTDVKFTFSKPFKGSTLTLTTEGPKSGRSGMSECKFVLEQDLHLPDICESFNAESDITFSKNLANSSLQLVSSTAPDCGFLLKGNFDLANVCETANIDLDISYRGAIRNSVLFVNSGGPGSCDHIIGGDLNVDACETFTAKSSVGFSRQLDKSTLSIVPRGTPDCGFELTGNITLGEVCESANMSTNVKFEGAARKSVLTFRVPRSTYSIGSPPSAPGYPGYVSPDGVFYNEQGAASCDSELFGSIVVDACETFITDYQINFVGAPVRKSNWSLSSSSAPSCAAILTGDVEIQACTDFFAGGTINFSGNAVKSGGVQLLATGQPSCGVMLTGDVEINACASVGLTAKQQGTGKVKVMSYSAGGGAVTLGEMDMGISLDVVTTGECTSDIVLNIPDQELWLDGYDLEVDETQVDIVYGKDWEASKHNMRLLKEDKKLKLKGAGCCTTDFTCQGGGGPFEKSEIKLKKLKIKYEEWVVPECCEPVCGHHYMDWCPGIGEWKKWYLMEILSSPCCGSSNKIDMCKGQVDVASSAEESASGGGSSSRYNSTGVYFNKPGESYSFLGLDGFVTQRGRGKTTISGSTVVIGGDDCEFTEERILKVDKILPTECCENHDNYLDLCQGHMYFTALGSNMDLMSDSLKLSDIMCTTTITPCSTSISDTSNNNIEITPTSFKITDSEGNNLSLSASKITISSDSCEKKSVFEIDQLTATACCEQPSILDLCEGNLTLNAADGNSSEMDGTRLTFTNPDTEQTLTIDSGGIVFSGAACEAYGHPYMSVDLLQSTDCCDDSGYVDLCKGWIHIEKDGAVTDIIAGQSITIETNGSSEGDTTVDLRGEGLTIAINDGNSVSVTPTGIFFSSQSCPSDSVMQVDRVMSTDCCNGRTYMDLSTGWTHLEDEAGNNSDIIAGQSLTMSSQEGDSVDLRASGLNISSADGSTVTVIPGNISYTDADGNAMSIVSGETLSLNPQSGATASLSAGNALEITNAEGDSVSLAPGAGLTITSVAGGSISMPVLEGRTATWRQVTFCVGDNETKTAFVLMTEPE